VFSQLALAIPLCILYELGIVLAQFVGKPITDEEKKQSQRGMTDSELNRELDNAEDEQKKLDAETKKTEDEQNRLK
jgi:sec-independent protein translocase protein TatC